MTPVLKVKNIVVRRGRRFSLQVDDFAIQPQEVVALIGPNGAGKSTLLTILACLAPPDRGNCFLPRRKSPREMLWRYAASWRWYFKTLCC